MPESHGRSGTGDGGLNGRFFIRLVLKTGLIILVINLVFAYLDPMESLSKLTLYNILYPGRPRLPYGDDPSVSYNLTVNQLDAMFASHLLLDHPKEPEEFRVFLLGDSSVWGFLQRPEETLTAQLNARNLVSGSGQRIKFYNLGYPTLSLTKDLLLLDYASAYQPDLILWFVTLESFPSDKQLDSPLLALNSELTRNLVADHNLIESDISQYHSSMSFWDRSVFGRRQLLADLFRYQVYGLLWSATGIDQEIPETFELRAVDLENDSTYRDLAPEGFDRTKLAFDVIRAGINLTQAPVVLVNEPIFISEGMNSDIRYNFYYPRWVYDRYREMLAEVAEENEWDLIDLWDLLPGDLFTDSAIHYNLDGVELVVDTILSSPQVSFVAK